MDEAETLCIGRRLAPPTIGERTDIQGKTNTPKAVAADCLLYD